MTLSDHLDMVGVTLKASWVQSSKANGDALQSKVKNTVNPWKAGKFLPITQRGWSLNAHALAKVWFRAKSVDLRVCDLKSITSTCKSWLYQDMLIKPEEMLLHRPSHYGGLGLHHVKQKALAGFISTFIQTAANPKYQSNLLHTLLYRKYVLEEDHVDGVPTQLPPYLSEDFFSIIRKVKNQPSFNIVNMTEKDWSRTLTEDEVTMRTNPETGLKAFRPCKAELNSISTDWDLSWALCRQQGMAPDLSSFLWKMLLDLLCTQQRLNRIGASPSDLCKLCTTEIGTLEHELIICSHNANTGYKLVTCLQTYVPTITAKTLLHLQLANLEVSMQLPLTILLAVTLASIWKQRITNSRVCAYQVRSQLEQAVNLLRTTRLPDADETLKTLQKQMFQ